ncbi:hypothetical protein DUNSADRAFT_8444 [Dunaliella salina]|uniref:Uncharacterized protein n=1 Tax=Dunaliella salina TaxID=3046 RepID=A0ABQ7GJG8_DUNSA|nr:hypothetical protein DUNSADRAFT_8444 [Dunaliella salina]KAF5834757.1 hypothetical protein DUNSADRAFT_8444 [Dunaliella salina]|eukprot:KAF5834756.1 hypothetical protein DUNSADRAFT_8444 [Dunaliella salina]
MPRNGMGQHEYRVEQVREEYLEQNGVGPAIRDALKSLFSEPRLPDNPYFYLASLLAAYVDQSPLWKLSDADIASTFDMECAVEVVQPDTKLCRHAQTPHCYGLPHVVRLAPKSGVEVLSHVLNHGVPEAFFPSSLPFRVGNGYTVQEFCSVQGSCCVWHPSLMQFPALEVRSDVLISGARMDEAVRIFIDLVLTCVEEVGAVPLYFVDGIAIMDPPCQVYEGSKQPFYQFFHMDDILERQEDFEKLAIRQVLGHKVVKMSCVLMIEVPQGGHSMEGNGQEQGHGQLRYELATKSYFFHYASLEPSTIEYDQMQHYGTMPYEALYEGYFLTLSTARQYMQMFQEVDKQPYGPVALPSNLESLKRQIERTLYAGKSLDAFRQLLHLILIQDAEVTLSSQLSIKHVRSLEQTIMTGRGRARGRGNPAAHGRVSGLLANPTVLGVVPNLLRTLASSAATIQGISREVEAISSAGDKWPAKVKQMRQAHAEAVMEGRLKTAQTAGSINSRRTLRTPEVDSSMLSWLNTFDMEGKLLLQLEGIKRNVQASMGKGVFSGSMSSRAVYEQLFWCWQLLRHNLFNFLDRFLDPLQVVLVQLVQLLHVGSLTIAHSFLGRCADIVWGLNCVGVQVTSIADVQEASGEAAMRSGAGGQLDSAAESALTPDWVLDVHSVAGAQVQNGGLAERVSVEGAMLQYAVDVHLDETLSMLWHQVSQPPQPLNPFPKLMHIVRSRAAKMELWLDEEEESLLRLVNELTLSAAGDVGASGWMYTGHRALRGLQVEGGSRSALGGQARAQGQEEEELGSSVVFGCYSAVTLADARALHALGSVLGTTLLADRHWQQGAYTCEVVPALCGDAALTNAMELHDFLKPSQAQQLDGMSAGGVTAGDPHHVRLFGLQAEEHHLVTGPKRKEAALVFGKEVMQRLLSLHRDSPHLLLSLELWVSVPLAARLVEESLATSSSLANVTAVQRPDLASSAGSMRDISSPGEAYLGAHGSYAGLH